MCGIGGIFSKRDTRTAAMNLSEGLRHRGPDDVGIAELSSKDSSTCGMFAHRRLAIIDLSIAGHQPMFSPDNRCCFT
jgi:asparagine synthase (glutamine-hydrolysing)